MADKILAKELVDYSKTDKLLEWQRLIPWINLFANKKVKGTFNRPRAVKALADYLAKDVYERYVGGKRYVTRAAVDPPTRLLFGSLMLTVLTPRINTTAARMKKLGLVKGKLVKPHPDRRYR